MAKIFQRISLFELILISFLITSALSCKCMQRSIPDDFNAASVVFEGIVTNVNVEDYKLTAEFLVTQGFKGVTILQRTLSIETNSEPSACGVGFIKGQRYVVFAHSDENGNLSTNTCTRTRESDPATMKELIGLRLGLKR
jgi:hypothetical protein